jgi:hypothetical protein
MMVTSKTDGFSVSVIALTALVSASEVFDMIVLCCIIALCGGWYY